MSIVVELFQKWFYKKTSQVMTAAMLKTSVIRKTLVMNPRCADGLVDRHSKKQVIEGDLLDRGDDAASAGGTQAEYRALFVEDDRGGHGRHRSSPGTGQVGGRAGEAKRVIQANPSRKVIHFVVHDDSGGGVSSPKGKVDGGGHGGDVALGVGHAEVRGAASFGLNLGYRVREGQRKLFGRDGPVCVKEAAAGFYRTQVGHRTRAMPAPSGKPQIWHRDISTVPS